jgi:hypothetical protein
MKLSENIFIRFSKFPFFRYDLIRASRNTDVALNMAVIVCCKNLPNNVNFADFHDLCNLRISCTISALLKIIIYKYGLL